jgi:hypothetical protein
MAHPAVFFQHLSAVEKVLIGLMADRSGFGRWGNHAG